MDESNDETELDTSDSFDELKTPFTSSFVSRSILSVLEDKNRFISLLKKRIQNQKVQLQFYLHRGLNVPKIIDMAKDCVAVEAEENLVVHLALVKFCNHTGLKSRIAALHDRMVAVEQQVVTLVEDQEEAIQKILFSLGNERLEQKEQCEILSKILDATCVLRSELEVFRTCCNRLIVIEDERNDLVEQVYSVPVSERINYNALLATLHEKTRLEKEMVDIKQEQQGLILRLNAVSSSDEEDCIKPCSTLAKQQMTNGKYEINRLKKINCTLEAKVSYLQQDIDCKEIIENKMETVIDEYQHFRENAAVQLTQLHNKLGTVIGENEKLNDMLSGYKDIEDEVKCLRNRLKNINGLQKERDRYKIKFEGLQTVRNDYVQILQKPFETLLDADKIITQQKEQIHCLERQLRGKTSEIQRLRMIIDEKENKIKELSDHINAYEVYKPKENLVDNAVNTLTSYYKDVACNTNSSTPIPKRLSRASNCEKCFLRESEDKFLRKNEFNAKKIYSKAVPVTTLKVHSINSKGLTETLRAVVESTSPVDGIIQLTNNSTFTVRLTCGSQMDSQNSTQDDANNAQENCTNLSNNFKCSTIAMDEFELMKDSSNEGLVARMPSFHSLQQRTVMERQKRQIFVDGDKCEEITIDSIYESERRRGYSDTTSLDLSDVDEDDDDSSAAGDVSFKDRMKKIVDNSLCRQVFEKLFHDTTERLKD